MPFETLQRVSGEEAEPDRAQFQSFVFVHTVLLRVDVECFLDSALQTVPVPFAIDHFHIVEIKDVLFEDRMLSSSRPVKSSVFEVRRVLLYAYTGCASRFSNVCLFTVATFETIYNPWVILSTGPIFQLLLERPLPVSWLSNYSYIQRPQDSLQGLGYSSNKLYEHCCLSPLILGLSISRSHRLFRLPLFNPGQVVVDDSCRVVCGKQLLFDFRKISLLLFFVCYDRFSTTEEGIHRATFSSDRMVRFEVEITGRMRRFPVDRHAEVSALSFNFRIEKRQLTVFFNVHSELNCGILLVDLVQSCLQCINASR